MIHQTECSYVLCPPKCLTNPCFCNPRSREQNQKVGCHTQFADGLHSAKTILFLPRCSMNLLCLCCFWNLCCSFTTNGMDKAAKVPHWKPSSCLMERQEHLNMTLLVFETGCCLKRVYVPLCQVLNMTGPIWSDK